jgi:hypothetical protein
MAPAKIDKSASGILKNIPSSGARNLPPKYAAKYAATRHLSRQTATPAPQNFEQNQSERERNKHELPKRRPGSGLKLRVHSFEKPMAR